MKLIVNAMGMGIKAIGDLRPAEAFEMDGMRDPVSYTHLTLPTILLV